MRVRVGLSLLIAVVFGCSSEEQGGSGAPDASRADSSAQRPDGGSAGDAAVEHAVIDAGPASVEGDVVGDDWWLPDWVVPSSNTGLYGGWNIPEEYKQAALATFTWAQLNPADDVYDFAPIDAALAGASSSRPIVLRIYNSDKIHCPSWLAQKYPNLEPPLRFRWPDAPYPDTLGNTSPGDFYPLWHPGLDAELKQFLKAFAARNYGGDARIEGWYVPGGWEWNEWSLKWVPEMSAQGITPTAYMTWFRSLIDAYVDAMNGQAGKLIYTGVDSNEWVEWTQESAGTYDAWVTTINTGSTNAMSTYAVQRGSGTRYGATEWFNYVTVSPNWGLEREQSGGGTYMVTNDQAPILTDGRFFGTENECYSTCGTAAGTDDYYHVKMATLKALQLRMTWLFISDFELAPEVHHFALRELGKRPNDTPDAWVALREGQDLDDPDKLWLRNWERWIIQREVEPDGLTLATAEVTSPHSQVGTSREARSTQHAAGSDYIYFAVDDAFLRGGANEVLVKVTYLDTGNASWRIEYDSQSDAYKPTPAVDSPGDGSWHTVTFRLPDAAFEGRQTGGMDLRLWNGGASDLVVRFVRVIKTTPPT